MLAPLHRMQYVPLLHTALLEDLGAAGDLTTDALVDPTTVARADIVARGTGRVAGLDVAIAAFRVLDDGLGADTAVRDGSDVAAGTVLASLHGSARALLTAERVALNVLGRMCGIATATASLVAAVGDRPTRIVPTRKTTPGLRLLERYAVRAGGGVDHRFGLADGVLVKDNHIALAGGITPAVSRVRRRVGHMVKIEVEVDTLAQLDEAVGLDIDAVLLDNMRPAELAAAVRATPRRIVTEASGGITPETVPDVAATGVDLISVGWITHSAPALDVGLDVTTPP